MVRDLTKTCLTILHIRAQTTNPTNHKDKKPRIQKITNTSNHSHTTNHGYNKPLIQQTKTVVCINIILFVLFISGFRNLENDILDPREVVNKFNSFGVRPVTDLGSALVSLEANSPFPFHFRYCCQ